MRVTLPVLLLAPALLAGSAALAQTTTPARGFEGAYRVSGEMSDGRSYQGEAKVVRTGDTLSIAWRIGGEMHVGTGIESGGQMAAVFAANGPGLPGLVVYRHSPDGKVVGVYTVLGDTRTALETWEKVEGPTSAVPTPPPPATPGPPQAPKG